MIRYNPANSGVKNLRLIEVIRYLKNAYLVFEWVEEDLNSFIATRAENNLPIREVQYQ